MHPSETVKPMKENNAKSHPKHGVGIRVIGGVATLIAIALAFLAFALASRIGDVQNTLATKEHEFVECSSAIDDLQMASDYLTSQARSFVITGRRNYLDAYVNELDVTNRRGKAVEVLRLNFTAGSAAAKTLEQALVASDALAQTEMAAMKMVADYNNMQDLPESIAQAKTTVFMREGSSQSELETATSLVLGQNYDAVKQTIQSKVEASSNALLSELNEELDENTALVQSLLFSLHISVALLLCDIMVLVLALFMYVLKPLGDYVSQIESNEPLDPDGAHELHYLANAYNAMYEDNTKHIEQLRAFAERDPLTGISNRNGYDSFLATHTRDIVLLLIDIDDFAEYNNVYGHDAGDEILARLAEALSVVFRSTDFPCRIENDMFAVIMTNMSSNLRNVIVSKIESVNTELANGAEDLPLVTFSAGAAFSTEGMSDKDIFRAASVALQEARQSDSEDIVFYGEGHANS